MIAAILARLGIPAWVAAAALCLLGAAALVGYRDHLIGIGVSRESTRRDLVEAERTRQAQDALRLANTRVKAAQDRLDAAIADIGKLQKELTHVQTQGAALQSDLAAGRRRLPVLVRARAADPARPPDAAGAAGLDTGTAVPAELDPAVAAGLARLTGEGDAAIVRLNACIAAYDAVIRAYNETE
ncbi:lysis system i-spanin subunit Rz [Massilia sp. Root335]|uniref:lysis system i-spanin subunit Rz n=1 Tax=Massilia sp. Root335 TaxID=1736517 RepID=UPI0006F31334|nr:lysis system i-spanin subunit Rz [Massilia sp. Root335]